MKIAKHKEFLLWKAVDGKWGDWSNWSTCSRTCDNGIQKRFRSCDNPPPQGQGDKCNGALIQEKSRTCKIKGCKGTNNLNSKGKYTFKKFLTGIKSLLILIFYFRLKHVSISIQENYQPHVNENIPVQNCQKPINAQNCFKQFYLPAVKKE